MVAGFSLSQLKAQAEIRGGSVRISGQTGVLAGNTQIAGARTQQAHLLPLEFSLGYDPNAVTSLFGGIQTGQSPLWQIAVGDARAVLTHPEMVLSLQSDTRSATGSLKLSLPNGQIMMPGQRCLFRGAA